MKNSRIVTKAITHIRLHEINKSKLEQLDLLGEAYQALCQNYVTYFCTEALPDKFSEAVLASELSERWQRVAIMQASGIAQAWRTQRDKAYQLYLNKLEWFEQKYLTAEERNYHSKEAPQWRDFKQPELKRISIQANENVALLTNEDSLPLKLEKSRGQGFDYWLRISTLEKYKTIWLPIRLAHYHRNTLKDNIVNTSIVLERRNDGSWWLTLSYDKKVEEQKILSEPIGVDIGITNFITTSTGLHYGTFQGDLANRFEREHQKRRRKAKLRAILEKKGVEKLPSTKSYTSARLQRHVVQSINKAVKDCIREHPSNPIILENINVSTMRFKSRRMNAKLSASHLAHIPKQIEFVGIQAGLPVIKVNPAYSSQECSQCHFVHRDNRPNQQTFCCRVCGYNANADKVAACNLASRWQDKELEACANLAEVKSLLLYRHEVWKAKNGYS